MCLPRVYMSSSVFLGWDREGAIRFLTCSASYGLGDNKKSLQVTPCACSGTQVRVWYAPMQTFANDSASEVCTFGLSSKLAGVIFPDPSFPLDLIREDCSQTSVLLDGHDGMQRALRCPVCKVRHLLHPILTALIIYNRLSIAYLCQNYRELTEYKWVSRVL